MVTVAWKKLAVTGCRSLCLKEKMELLKHRIKQWRADNSSTNLASLKALRSEMTLWDKRAVESKLSEAEAKQFCATRSHYFQAEKELSQQVKQKSRVNWAAEGDKNVAFFHGMVKGRLNRNIIKGLNVNGSWIEEPQKLKEFVFCYFKDHFSERVEVRPSFKSDKFQKLNQELCSWLELEFTADEIKQAVWDCGGSKAAGPDGFTFNFLKQNWEVMKDDILKFVKEFELKGEWRKAATQLSSPQCLKFVTLSLFIISG